MDTQIQQTAKPSSFVKAGGANAGPALSWFDANRARIIQLSILAAVVILIAIVAGTYITNNAAKANGAFSDAMDVYDAPLRQPGQPVDPSTPSYATAADRARVAHPLFTQVADKYSWFAAGANARYFAGLTAADLGQTSEAESDLKKVADGHDSGVGSLAKMALASLYRKTNRPQQAIELYQQLIAKPTLTVPASMSRLALAETYEGTKPEEARKLYAQIKDQDKTSAAAQIASQKLEGKK